MLLSSPPGMPVQGLQVHCALGEDRLGGVGLACPTRVFQG